MNIDGFPVYVDPNMHDTHIYRGYKHDSNIKFFIVGTRIANMLYLIDQRRQRKLKLERININLENEKYS